MYTPCALTRLASVVKQNKDVRLLTAACGVLYRLYNARRLAGACRCWGSLSIILAVPTVHAVRWHTQSLILSELKHNECIVVFYKI